MKLINLLIQKKKTKDLSSYYKHSPFNLKFFIKDIEISKRDYMLLFLIFNSLVFLILYQFGLIQATLSHGQKDDTNPFIFTIIFSSVLIGFVISILLVDNLRRPISYIKYTLISSLIIIVTQIPFHLLQIYTILMIFFFINIILLIIALMTICKIFLVKTTILERGRTMAYLFVSTFICIAIIFGSGIIDILILIPIFFVILTIVILQRNKERFNIIFQKFPKDDKEKKFQIDLIKYYLFFFCFSFTAGLATSPEEAVQFATDTLGGNIALLFLIVLLFAIFVSILIGIIFDYIGRMGALTYIILAIAVATYIRIFNPTTYNLPLAVVFTAHLAAIMCVPLLIGDTVTRKNFGKTLSFSYLIILIGILTGMGLGMRIKQNLLDESFASDIIIGTIFMSCILCLIFLVSMRETLPHKEQAWKDFLYHIYIIHNSGILLYEHAFVEENKIDESVVSSDLKAGGIIGVKSILKEIVNGKEEVETIDSGDRILMINHSNKVVYALIVKEELIVLRKKLEALIDDFNEKYFEIIKNINSTGVVTHVFEPVQNLIRKHFGS